VCRTVAENTETMAMTGKTGRTNTSRAYVPAMRAIYVPRPRMPPKRWLSSDAGMPGL
jgi:hypothetical protein